MYLPRLELVVPVTTKREASWVRTTSKYCSVEKNILQVLSNDQYHGAHNSKPGVYYITLKLFKIID